MRTLGLAVLVSLVLVEAGCGGTQSQVANNSMRPVGILVSGGKLHRATASGSSQSRLIVLDRSIGRVHLGESRSDVENALGPGTLRHGWTSYSGGRLLVDYVAKVRKTTHVQALATGWTGFRTHSGIHVGSTVHEVRQRLHIPCGRGSCTTGVPGEPSTILSTRRGKVVRVEVLYLS